MRIYQSRTTVCLIIEDSECLAFPYNLINLLVYYKNHWRLRQRTAYRPFSRCAIWMANCPPWRLALQIVSLISIPGPGRSSHGSDKSKFLTFQSVYQPSSRWLSESSRFACCRTGGVPSKTGRSAMPPTARTRIRQPKNGRQVYAATMLTQRVYFTRLWGLFVWRLAGKSITLQGMTFLHCEVEKKKGS